MGNNGCFDGFGKAIADARSKNVDFIMTGGDNEDFDVLKGDGENQSCEGRKPVNVHWIPTFMRMKGRGNNAINTFKN
jgi:hypothetical protein